MHFLDTMKALNEGRTVTICNGFGGSTFGHWRVRNHRLEFRRDASEEWKSADTSLTTFTVGAFRLVGDEEGSPTGDDPS